MKNLGQFQVRKRTQKEYSLAFKFSGCGRSRKWSAFPKCDTVQIGHLSQYYNFCFLRKFGELSDTRTYEKIKPLKTKKRY